METTLLILFPIGAALALWIIPWASTKAAAGFATAVAVTEPWALESALRAAVGADGPHFVLVKVTAEEADVPRIPYTPAVLRDRFRAAVLGG